MSPQVAAGKAGGIGHAARVKGKRQAGHLPNVNAAAVNNCNYDTKQHDGNPLNR